MDVERSLSGWQEEIVHQGELAVLAIDGSGRLVHCSASVARLLGTTVEALADVNALDLIHPDDLGRAGANVEGVALGARPRPGMLRVRHADGTWIPLEMTPWVVDLPAPPDGPGRVTAVLLEDNSQNDAYWSFLASLASGSSFGDSVDLLARGLSSEEDGPMGISWEEGGERVAAGPVPGALVGVTPQGTFDSTPGTPWVQAVRTGQVSWCRVDDLPEPMRTMARSIGAGAIVALPVPDPEASHPAILVQLPAEPAMGPILLESIRRRPFEALSVAIDRRSVDQRLARLALRDPLTDLANRTRLFEALADLAARPDGYGVCYVDLDRFKAINDTHGHRVGDDVLVACSARLLQSIRADDVAARIGGDEFAVACPGVSAEELEAIAARIVAALSAPVRVGSLLLPVGASVGCVLGEPGADPDAVLGAADEALYEAKRSGKGCFHRGGDIAVA